MAVLAGAGIPVGAADRVEILLGAMTLREKVGQLFVSRVYGDEAREQDAALVMKNRQELGVDNAAQLVARYHVGGIIYFGWAGNLVSAKQTARLSNGIQSTAMSRPVAVPVLIATDQEGGSVTRLKAPATQFAGNMALGAGRRADLARDAGRVMGRELRAVGIMQTFAPVADVNVNPANPIIGIRAYGSRPALVSSMTVAQVQGFQLDAGIAATAKHFPGHGDTDTDSHTGLPVIDHDRATWEAIDAPPFQAAIAAGVEVIMTAHISVPALDPSGRPATLSRPILEGVLREQFGFGGVVVTDSLGMAGVRAYGDARVPVLALQAGADMLLNPPNLPLAFEAVVDAVEAGQISVSRIDASVRRILRLKERVGLLDQQLVSVSEVDSIVGSTRHRAVERAVANASVTLVKNAGGVLPIAISGSVLLTGWGDQPTKEIAAALTARGVSSERYVTGSNPTDEQIRSAASRAAKHGYVIVLTRNADTATRQRKLIAALVATGKPVITVAVGRPYDIAYYSANIHLSLFSSSRQSMRALVRTLYGERTPSGKLPVSILRAVEPESVLYEFGHGLSY